MAYICTILFYFLSLRGMLGSNPVYPWECRDSRWVVDSIERFLEDKQMGSVNFLVARVAFLNLCFQKLFFEHLLKHWVKVILAVEPQVVLPVNCILLLPEVSYHYVFRVL